MFMNRLADACSAADGPSNWPFGSQSNPGPEYLCAEVAWTSEVTDKPVEPLSYLEGNSFILYILLIITLFIVLEIVLYLIRRRRGKRGRYEGPDYIQYRRRI